VYHSYVIAADYKLTLRNAPAGDEYERKKGEVHQRAADRLLKVRASSLHQNML
jgi:hypothetical protein